MGLAVETGRLHGNEGMKFGKLPSDSIMAQQKKDHERSLSEKITDTLSEKYARVPKGSVVYRVFPLMAQMAREQQTVVDLHQSMIDLKLLHQPAYISPYIKYNNPLVNAGVAATRKPESVSGKNADEYLNASHAVAAIQLQIKDILQQEKASPEVKDQVMQVGILVSRLTEALKGEKEHHSHLMAAIIMEHIIETTPKSR